jgi:hypothetical protein
MRFVTCGICRNEKIQLNESLLVDDVIHCENCLKDKFPTDADLTGKKIVREFDPTICSQCSKDSGDVLLKQLGSYPICSACEQAIELRVFPKWVKAFFAAVLVLVVFSLTWNWRFIEAYYELKKIDAVVESGVIEDAANLYSGISANVPEIPEFGQLSRYYKGVLLLREDKGAEALAVFKSCTALPENYGIPVLTLQAEISTLFDSKDYPGFVNASKRYLLYDTSSIAIAQVASAYACMYADQKSDSAKSMAMKYLEKATGSNDTTRFFSEYVNRIEYRLASGEIIDQKTFAAKFPNGWTK